MRQEIFAMEPGISITTVYNGIETGQFNEGPQSRSLESQAAHDLPREFV